MTFSLLVGVGAVFGLASALFYSKCSRSRTPLLPPGPTGSFFSGVQHQLPKTEPWKTYTQWSKDFQSPVISFRVYNQTIVVLNDVKSVRTLLEQRSHIYSDRPMSWMLNVICERGKAIFNISSTDPRHRIYRQLFQTEVGERGTKRYWEMMRDEIRILSNGFISTPEDWHHHVVRNFTSLIMRLAFGYSIKNLDDPFIQTTEESAKISGWATAPGRWLVNYFPLLRFVPSWLPGAGWKRQGLRWRERLRSLSQVPHNWVKETMEKGRYEPSFTSRLLNPEDETRSVSGPISAEDEDIIQWCAGGLYVGATHTTISALTSFLLLMALHPDVQEKAQREIDVVFNQTIQSGFIDTPTPDNTSKLQYLGAILKEVLRFAPIGNLGLPHRLIVDDEYMGFGLPKGATIIGNIWAIMHDPEIYPEPFKFSPERFMVDRNRHSGPGATEKEQTQIDPRQFAYGFGRRSCPGIHFAETALLLSMAAILARFQIKEAPSSSDSLEQKRVEGNSRIIEFTTGITSHIKPFPIVIAPRSLSS